MNKLTANIVEWIGICPLKNTLGGWSNKALISFLVKHTSLSEKEAWRIGGTVKSRFHTLFEMLPLNEQASISKEILITFPQSPTAPYRSDERLKIIAAEIENITKTTEQSDLEMNLAILGMSSLTTSDNLKKNYLKKISSCHPDKVDSLDKDFKELADKKSKEINAAFEYLKNRVGQ